MNTNDYIKAINIGRFSHYQWCVIAMATT